MKTTYFFLAFIGVLGYVSFLNHRDTELFKAYDACMISTSNPNCPDSWKTKPAFSHR